MENIDNDFAASTEWALVEIKNIQTAARSGNPIVKPRWPIIILRSPKGLTGPKSINGELIEGSFHSHQVPLPNVKKDSEELAALEQWLESYRPEELFSNDGGPNEEILSIIPVNTEKRLGQKAEAYKAYNPLKLPNWIEFGVQKGAEESSMKTVGTFLKGVINE